MGRYVHADLNTPARLALTAPLTRHHGPMTSSNAGIKRNRLKAGIKPWETKLRFSPDLKPTLLQAAEASGKLSPALYLELLLRGLEDEDGNLPVIAPTLEASEVKSIATA